MTVPYELMTPFSEKMQCGIALFIITCRRGLIIRFHLQKGFRAVGRASEKQNFADFVRGWKPH
jgi:hypothetical protein